MPTRCFLQIQGRWYALMNWRARASRADTVVFRALSSEEEALLQSMKHDGLREAAIFAQLYPPQVVLSSAQEVQFPVALLTKAQLSYLIENRLGGSLPSLKKMHKDDLMVLLHTLMALPGN